jgi:hypothetical protein
MSGGKQRGSNMYGDERHALAASRNLTLACPWQLVDVASAKETLFGGGNALCWRRLGWRQHQDYVTALPPLCLILSSHVFCCMVNVWCRLLALLYRLLRLRTPLALTAHSCLPAAYQQIRHFSAHRWSA